MLLISQYTSGRPSCLADTEFGLFARHLPRLSVDEFAIDELRLVMSSDAALYELRLTERTPRRLPFSVDVSQIVLTETSILVLSHHGKVYQKRKDADFERLRFHWHKEGRKVRKSKSLLASRLAANDMRIVFVQKRRRCMHDTEVEAGSVFEFDAVRRQTRRVAHAGGLQGAVDVCVTKHFSAAVDTCGHVRCWGAKLPFKSCVRTVRRGHVTVGVSLMPSAGACVALKAASQHVLLRTRAVLPAPTDSQVESLQRRCAAATMTRLLPHQVVPALAFAEQHERHNRPLLQWCCTAVANNASMLLKKALLRLDDGAVAVLETVCRQLWPKPYFVAQERPDLRRTGAPFDVRYAIQVARGDVEMLQNIACRVARRMRTLRKKLQQIALLESQHVSLNASQRNKLLSKYDAVQELCELDTFATQLPEVKVVPANATPVQAPSVSPVNQTPMHTPMHSPTHTSVHTPTVSSSKKIHRRRRRRRSSGRNGISVLALCAYLGRDKTHSVPCLQDPSQCQRFRVCSSRRNGALLAWTRRAMTRCRPWSCLQRHHCPTATTVVMPLGAEGATKTTAAVATATSVAVSPVFKSDVGGLSCLRRQLRRLCLTHCALSW
ncbi:MAG: hypothetical protein MHM6MM_008224, partial [Cercozoa sp. M6MM]